MKVTVESIQIALPPSKQARSKGIHVSSIIRCVAQETGILKPEWCEELDMLEIKPNTRFDDPVVALRVSIGLAWEEWYIREVLGPEGVVDHPGELFFDGIYLSPDAEELSAVIVDRKPKHRLKIHEIKTTAKSTNTVGETEEELQGQWMWMAQLKAYCKAAGTTLADLHVLFLYGAYERPFMRPVKKRYHIEFTQDELDDNWALLTRYRDHRLIIETSGHYLMREDSEHQ